MKTATVTKLNEAQKLLKAAHETMTAAIAADPKFATLAMADPKNKDVELLITALLKTNSAGKNLQDLIERQD